MKILTYLTAMTAIFSNLSAAESTSHLRIAVDPMDAKNRSHIDFLSQNTFDMGNFNLIISPEIAFFLNGSADFGLSIGHRWQLASGMIGHHVFVDRSQFPFMAVNQIGTGLDYLTEKIDFRANYYHPISAPIKIVNRIIKPCRWMEGEINFKLPFCNLAYGPTLNVDTGILGLQGKVVVPFERFSLGVGASTDQNGNRQAFVMTSFNLYGPSKQDSSVCPISHNKHPKLCFLQKNSKQKPFEEADLMNEEEKIKSDKEQEEDFEKSVDEYWQDRWEREAMEISEEVNQEIPTVQPVPSKSVWQSIKDFFVGEEEIKE